MNNTLTYDLQNVINTNKAIVSYSYSSLTHSFLIRDIVITDLSFVENLKQALVESCLGNGDIFVYTHNLKLLSIAYETTDTYEFSDDFACELAENINEVVIKFLANTQTK
jgi:hypothetical protein